MEAELALLDQGRRKDIVIDGMIRILFHGGEEEDVAVEVEEVEEATEDVIHGLGVDQGLQKDITDTEMIEVVEEAEAEVEVIEEAPEVEAVEVAEVVVEDMESLLFPNSSGRKDLSQSPSSKRSLMSQWHRALL